MFQYVLTIGEVAALATYSAFLENELLGKEM